MFRSTTPRNALILDQLTTALSEVSIGEVRTYLELGKAAPGFNQDKNFWLLSRAKERVERQLGCVFSTVRDVGIKRLLPSDIPGIGLAALGHIRRHARREKKRLDRVSTNSLSTNEQRRVIGMSAMLGAIVVVADGRKASAVAAVADPAKPIPPANILAMFQTEHT